MGEIKILIMAIMVVLCAISNDAHPAPCNTDETCYLLGKYDLYGAISIRKEGSNYVVVLDDGTTVIGKNIIGAISFNKFDAHLNFSCYATWQDGMEGWCNSSEQTEQYIKERIYNWPGGMKIGRFLPTTGTKYSMHTLYLVEEGEWIAEFYMNDDDTEEQRLKCHISAGKFEFNHGLTKNIEEQIRRCVE
jgi:hypothetical protein